MSTFNTRMREPAAKWCRSRAFTLVELLVVIGIIAVLISVLLPVLGKAKEAANSAKCLSNMKQVGMTVMLYVNDNKGKWLPPYKAAEFTPNYTPSGTPSWNGAFFFTFLSGRYLKEDPKIWTCPTDRYIDTRPFQLRLYSNVRDSNSSYMMNLDAPHYANPVNYPSTPGLYGPPLDHVTWFYPRPLKYVKKPSEHLIFWESAVNVAGAAAYMASYRSVGTAMRFDHRKRTSMTIGFADGRADQLDRSFILLRPGETTHGPARIRQLWYGSPNYPGVMQIRWGSQPPF